MHKGLDPFNIRFSPINRPNIWTFGQTLGSGCVTENPSTSPLFSTSIIIIDSVIIWTSFGYFLRFCQQKFTGNRDMTHMTIVFFFIYSIHHGPNHNATLAFSVWRFVFLRFLSSSKLICLYACICKIEARILSQSR